MSGERENKGHNVTEGSEFDPSINVSMAAPIKPHSDTIKPSEAEQEK